MSEEVFKESKESAIRYQIANHPQLKGLDYQSAEFRAAISALTEARFTRRKLPFKPLYIVELASTFDVIVQQVCQETIMDSTWTVSTLSFPNFDDAHCFRRGQLSTLKTLLKTGGAFFILERTVTHFNQEVDRMEWVYSGHFGDVFAVHPQPDIFYPYS